MFPAQRCRGRMDLNRREKVYSGSSRQTVTFLFLFVYLLVAGFHAHICFHHGIGRIGDNAVRVTESLDRAMSKPVLAAPTALPGQRSDRRCQSLVSLPTLPSLDDGFSQKTALKLLPKAPKAYSCRLIDDSSNTPGLGSFLKIPPLLSTNSQLTRIRTIVLLI